MTSKGMILDEVSANWSICLYAIVQNGKQADMHINDIMAVLQHTVKY